jgi:phosphoribosyl 1,2-cyclic phosphodiesterase
MKIVSLASGSSGNAFLIDTENDLLLLDDGLSYRSLTEELRELDRSPEEISAVLLTHEHADHISGLPALMKKHPNIPVYASYGTFDGLSKEKIFSRMNMGAFCLIHPGERFTAAGIDILPVATSHDTEGSLAYRGDKESSSFAVITDLGSWTEELAEKMEGLSVLCLEANHDLRMLETGPYPYPLKLRIRSERGHLSNDDAAGLLLRLWHPGLKEVLLSHLSKENNLPVLAVQTMVCELQTHGIEPDRLAISAAPRKGLSHAIIF